jgi:hypothetical protein
MRGPRRSSHCVRTTRLAARPLCSCGAPTADGRQWRGRVVDVLDLALPLFIVDRRSMRGHDFR